MAVAIAALGIFSAPVLAETAADVPKESYYNDPLTATERSGIAHEENVSPNDGQASVPNAVDEGVIPDAADTADQKAATETQEPNLQKDVNRGAKQMPARTKPTPSSIKKKDFKVTKQDLDDCLKDWDPQTQMTKAESERELPHDARVLPDGQ